MQAYTRKVQHLSTALLTAYAGTMVTCLIVASYVSYSKKDPHSFLSAVQDNDEVS